MNLTAIVEIPAGSLFKYELNKETGLLKLDRPLNQFVPCNYGYFPETLSPDGDPADVFVLTDEPIYPLTEVTVKIVGVLKCIDNGVEDDKILADLVGDYKACHGASRIEKYLESYKLGFKVIRRGDAEEGLKIYRESVTQYNFVTLPKY